MPRGPRLDAAGSLHHVIVRGIERTAIGRDDTDRAAAPGVAEVAEWARLLIG